MAVWMPVTVVPRSSATVAMDTFITELSSVIRNWPEARVSRTPLAAPVAAAAFDARDAMPSRLDGGPEGFGDLRHHRPLAVAHPFGVEAHEPAFLGGVGSSLGHRGHPDPERRGLFRRGLGGDDL